MCALNKLIFSFPNVNVGLMGDIIGKYGRAVTFYVFITNFYEFLCLHGGHFTQ